MDYKQAGDIMRPFVEKRLRAAHIFAMRELRSALQATGEELTELELSVFKEEFEYALCAIGAPILFSSISDNSKSLDQEMLANAYLMLLYLHPVCGEPMNPVKISGQHNDELAKGFAKYLRFSDLNMMVDEICKQVCGINEAPKTNLSKVLKFNILTPIIKDLNSSVGIH